MFHPLSVRSPVSLLLLLLLPPTSPKPPDLVVRLARPGVDFFSSVGHKIVERELPSAAFPTISLPIDSGPGAGQVNVTGLHIPPDRFLSPKFQFSLAPPSAIEFVSRGGTANVRGLWTAEYELIGITFYSSGWVDLVATDIRSRVSLGLGHSGVHPQLRVFGCSADVGQIEVQIGGGVIPWLVNLFRSQLGAALRQTIHEQFCEITKTTILGQLNSLLYSLPTRVPVTDGVFVEYAFGNDTQVTGSYLQQLVFVELSLGKNASACPFSAPSPLPLPEPASEQMLSLWLDESLFSCALRSLYQTQLLQLTVDPSFDGGHLAKFLRTTCAFYQLCMGRFFPELARRHPNQHVDFLFHASSAPALHFSPAQKAVQLDAQFFVDVYISPWTEHQAELLARLCMNASAVAEPKLGQKGRLGGELDALEVHFAEVSSSIGNISAKFLDTFTSLVRPVLKVALESTLRVGIPLPTVEDLRLGNGTELVALQRGLRVDARLEYGDAAEEGRQQG